MPLVTLKTHSHGFPLLGLGLLLLDLPPLDFPAVRSLLVVLPLLRLPLLLLLPEGVTSTDVPSYTPCILADLSPDSLVPCALLSGT